MFDNSRLVAAVLGQRLAARLEDGVRRVAGCGVEQRQVVVEPRVGAAARALVDSCGHGPESVPSERAALRQARAPDPLQKEGKKRKRQKGIVEASTATGPEWAQIEERERERERESWNTYLVY